MLNEILQTLDSKQSNPAQDHQSTSILDSELYFPNVDNSEILKLLEKSDAKDQDLLIIEI